MSPRWNRRDVLKGLAAASTAIIVRPKLDAIEESEGAGGRPVEIQIGPVSSHTFRLTLFAIGTGGSLGSIPSNGSLTQESWGAAVTKVRTEPEQTIAAGNVRLKISFHPVKVSIMNEADTIIQQLAWDDSIGALSFLAAIRRYLVSARADRNSIAAALRT